MQEEKEGDRFLRDLAAKRNKRLLALMIQLMPPYGPGYWDWQSYLRERKN